MKLLILVLISFALLKANDSTTLPKPRTLAIMDFKNYGPVEYDDFIAGVPDMMMTNLGSVPNLRVIERVQVEKAIRAFNLEASGFTAQNSIKIGQWLGADILVFGSLIHSGKTIRFDARFIDAATGQQITGSSVSGDESRTISLIDELSSKIADRFNGLDKKPEPVAQPPVAVPPIVTTQPLQPIVSMSTAPASIRVHFRMFCSLLAEEKFYHQKCRVYLDGKEIKLSDAINKLDIDYELLNEEVAPGSHSLEIVHYLIGKTGQCVRLADNQPRLFLFRVKAGESYAINYRLKLGNNGANSMVYDRLGVRSSN